MTRKLHILLKFSARHTSLNSALTLSSPLRLKQAFHDVSGALARESSRLFQFQAAPEKHRRHAMKVLIKFRLLEWQQIERARLFEWAQSTPTPSQVMPTASEAAQEWFTELLIELVQSHAIELCDNFVLNS